METLLKVRDLLYAHKFTIAGARRKLREGGIEPAPPVEDPTDVPTARVRDALREIRQDLAALVVELGDTSGG